MFGAGVRRQTSPQSDDLFARIGAFLLVQGLSVDPVNYAFAHRLLTLDDPDVAAMLDRIAQDGVRMTLSEIEALGGRVVPGAAMCPSPARPDTAKDDTAERLVSQSRIQVDAVATMVRAMHDETRGFGRDLAQSAAALEAEGEHPDAGEIVRLANGMIGRTADAEQRLASATREAETLRVELAEAQVSARRDPLTGLPNRRAFDEAFAALDPSAGHCLALCDVDQFKRINDAFGHAVGDRVLSALARLLSDQCEGQLVTRQGGEEFAVLLAGVDLPQACTILDGARSAASARRLRDRDNDAPIGRVTFSAGLVAVAAGESSEAALARADRLLYRAKAQGRDCVVAE